VPGSSSPGTVIWVAGAGLVGAVLFGAVLAALLRAVGSPDGAEDVPPMCAGLATGLAADDGVTAGVGLAGAVEPVVTGAGLVGA
jgi:hypothetical protein